MSSCFFVEQGVGHFTGIADEELTITFGAPWHTYPSVTTFQSPEVGPALKFDVVDGGFNYVNATNYEVTELLSITNGTGAIIKATVVANVMTDATVVNGGSGYEIGDELVLEVPALSPGTLRATLRVVPAHEDYHINLTITEVTKTYFKIKSSIQYTSVSFHWRAVGMNR